MNASRLAKSKSVGAIYMAVLIGAGIFFIARLVAGKSLIDSGRILGASVALGIWFLLFDINTLGQSFKNIAFGFVARVMSLKSRYFFLIIVITLASSHAVNGLVVHSWQGYDTAFFVQAVHNLFSEKGLMFKNIEGSFSFFGHHFSPFLFLFYPLSKIIELPFALYVAQDISISMIFALLFREIQRVEEIDVRWKGIFLLVVLSHPFWHGLIYFEFHELSFAPVIVFFILKGWQKRSSLCLLFSAICLLCIKETAVFSLLWFGAVLAVFDRDKKIKLTGGLIFLVAASVYYFYFKAMLPRIIGTENSLFSSYFLHLGSSQVEVILSPVLKPRAFLNALFNFENLVYLCGLFGVVLPLMGRYIFLLVPFLPDLALALLSSATNIKNPGHQYAGIIVVPILMCVVAGISNSKYWTPLKMRFVSGWGVIWFFSTIQTNPVQIWKSVLFDANHGAKSRGMIEVLRSLPRGTPVVVTVVQLLPFAAQRENLVWVKAEDYNDTSVAQDSYVVFETETLRKLVTSCATKFQWNGYEVCQKN